MRLYRCSYLGVDYDWTRKLKRVKKDIWDTKQEILSYAFDDSVFDIYNDCLELMCIDVANECISNDELRMLESGQIDLDDLNIDVDIKILKSWKLQRLRFGKYRWVVEEENENQSMA